MHDEVIFVSTISGTFYAVSQKSGKILWTLNEGNVVNLYYFSLTSIKFVKGFISLVILIIKCFDKAKPMLYIHEYIVYYILTHVSHALEDDKLHYFDEV